MTAMVRNWRVMYAIAPSWMASAISSISLPPLGGGQHALHEDVGDPQGGERHDEGDDEQGLVGAGERERLPATFRCEQVHL